MNNNSLMIQPSTIIFQKNLIKQKRAPANNTYPQLSLFKNQIEVLKDCPSKTPFSSEKPRVFFYKTLFLSIGLLYCVLAFLLYFKTVNWNSDLIFGNGAILKSALCSLCAFTSVVCGGIGFLINTKEESVRKIYSDAKKRAYMLYERKKIRNGINDLFNIGEKYRLFMEIRHHYHSTLAKLHEAKEETHHLMTRISTASLSRVEQEELYNQAALEFRDKLTKVNLAFKEN